MATHSSVLAWRIPGTGELGGLPSVGLHSDAFQGPLDFTFQDVWLQVSDHTIMVICVIKIFFVQFLCVSLPLVNIFCFCQAHAVSILYCAHLCMKIPSVSIIFLKHLQSFPFYFFPPFLCIGHLGKLSYLSLLFFGTLHSDGLTVIKNAIPFSNPAIPTHSSMS